MPTQTPPPPQMNERYHAFDALRASMMMLGIYLHAACAYTTVGHVWFYQDSQTGTIWDLQALLIHVFRMPVFFVMSGFFSALLVEKRNFAGYASNRLKRIALPFALFFLPLLALMHSLARFARLTGDDPLAAKKALTVLTSGNWLELDPMHLWFMVVLFCFLPLSWLLERALGGPIGAELDRWFTGLLKMTMAPMMLAIPTFFTLLTMPMGVLDTPQLLPQIHILAAYAVFHVVGWLLYRTRKSLHLLAGKAWTWVGASALATLAFGNCVVIQLGNLNRRDPLLTAAIAGTGAVLTWLIIFALIGLSLRYFNKTNPRIRWISDSSYWLYLVHPVVLVSFQALWKQAALPASAKFALTLIPTLAVLFVSYALLVRGTWLGTLLNGTPRRPAQRAQLSGVTLSEGSAGIS